MIALYGFGFSHYCVKAEKLLRHKGLAYESRHVPYHDKRELILATGQDYVPALLDGPRVVTWEALPDYLEEHYPDPTIYPAGNRGLARIVEAWAHHELEELAWRTVVTAYPATFTDEVERWVFVEMQERKRGPLAALAARQAEFDADLARGLGLVEGALATRPYLLGEAPGLADFAVFGALSVLPYVGRPLPAGFPKLEAWFARVAAI